MIYQTDREDHLVVEHPVPSKKNNYKPGQGGKLYIDPQVKADVDAITTILVGQRNKIGLKKPHGGSICIRLFFCIPIATVRRSRRQDRDNMTTTLFDCLQAARVIENDYMVDECHFKTHYHSGLNFTTHILISSDHFSQIEP